MSPSLSDVHRSVKVHNSGSAWKRLFAFLGPAYVVSVGYMDPGNWATDIEGGARFGYALLWVLIMSNAIAILLQTLSARLGIVSGRDLAQACRDNYPPIVAKILWILCEIAIAACDLAELLGTAIGLHLLFGVPLIWGVVITAADTLLLLAMQSLGMRFFEAFIIVLVFTIGLCFGFQIFLAEPSIGGILSGTLPSLPNGSLYVAIGIIGATVMPHNLYLHSALVQTRAFPQTHEGKRKACTYNLIDSAVALNAALFVNAAILIVSAAVFHRQGIVVTELEQAHSLLIPMLGTSMAGVAFAVALLAAGQSSTLTGTLAGQIVMEGFINFKMRPYLRRFITRCIAIIPAVFVLSTAGDKGTYDLLISSQVILSLQLPFAIVPLIHFTSSKRIMGEFANALWVKILAWISASVIILLNLNLVLETIREWAQNDANVLWFVLPIVLAILGFLCYVILHPLFTSNAPQMPVPSWQAIVEKLQTDATPTPLYKRIAVAIAHEENDSDVLRHAIGLAKENTIEIQLIHIVEGAVGVLMGNTTYDAEARSDEKYLVELASVIQTTYFTTSQIVVTTALGYGNVPKELVRLVREFNADVLIMGGHGHKGMRDILYGSTISPVRHELTVPVLVVR